MTTAAAMAHDTSPPIRRRRGASTGAVPAVPDLDALRTISQPEAQAQAAGQAIEDLQVIADNLRMRRDIAVYRMRRIYNVPVHMIRNPTGDTGISHGNFSLIMAREPASFEKTGDSRIPRLETLPDVDVKYETGDDLLVYAQSKNAQIDALRDMQADAAEIRNDAITRWFEVEQKNVPISDAVGLEKSRIEQMRRDWITNMLLETVGEEPYYSHSSKYTRWKDHPRVVAGLERSRKHAAKVGERCLYEPEQMEKFITLRIGQLQREYETKAAKASAAETAGK